LFLLLQLSQMTQENTMLFFISLLHILADLSRDILLPGWRDWKKMSLLQRDIMPCLIRKITHQRQNLLTGAKEQLHRYFDFMESGYMYTNPVISSASMISIVLLNWNGKRFLGDCIQSIRAQTYSEYDLIIIDDNSSDGSQEFLRHSIHDARVILHTENIGYCGGANCGIRETHGEYVLLMNPDILLEPDFLTRLLDGIRHDERIGIATGKLLRFDRHTLDSTGQFLRRNLRPLERGYGESDTWRYDHPEYVFSSCGALVMYRRTMLEEIALGDQVFDERYFAYYEDLDIGWRAQTQGWKAFYVPSAVACHYRGGGLAASTRKPTWVEKLPFVPAVSLLEKPPAIQRHIIKNRYLTLLKNASFREVMHGLPALVKFEVLLWGYILCVRPSLLRALFDLFRLFPETLRKRRMIQAKRKMFECLSGGEME